MRIAKLEDAGAITDLLNRATLDLHEKGIMQWDYPWDEAVISEQIRNDFWFCLWLESSLAGAFQLHPPLSVDEKRYTKAGSDCLYLSQVVVAPELQGRGLGCKLIEFAKDQALLTGVNLYLDCWAGNKKLRAFYSGVGFQHLGDQPEYDYMVSVFRFSV